MQTLSPPTLARTPVKKKSRLSKARDTAKPRWMGMDCSFDRLLRGTWRGNDISCKKIITINIHAAYKLFKTWYYLFLQSKTMSVMQLMKDIAQPMDVMTESSSRWRTGRGFISCQWRKCNEQRNRASLYSQYYALMCLLHSNHCIAFKFSL